MNLTFLVPNLFVIWQKICRLYISYRKTDSVAVRKRLLLVLIWGQLLLVLHEPHQAGWVLLVLQLYTYLAEISKTMCFILICMSRLSLKYYLLLVKITSGHAWGSGINGALISFRTLFHSQRLLAKIQLFKLLFTRLTHSKSYLLYDASSTSFIASSTWPNLQRNQRQMIRYNIYFRK